MMDQFAQLKSAFASMSTDHSEQLEALEKQRKDLAKRLDTIITQHQTDLNALREDVEATSQGQKLNLVKASTQRELSALRRDLQQMQTNLQQLQGRRYRAP